MEHVPPNFSAAVQSHDKPAVAGPLDTWDENLHIETSDLEK